MKQIKPFAFLLAAGLASTLAFAAIADDTKTTKDGQKQSEKAEKKADKADKKAEKGAKAEVGKPAPNFTLKTTDGKEWSLSDAAGKIVILQWCNPECPACERVTSDGTVAETLKGAREASADVVYVMVNSSAARPTSLEATGPYMKKLDLGIPALLDTEGTVGQMYGARTTPHMYVIDDKGVLRFNGAIDDGNGGTKGKTNFVVNAVKQIKAGETVAPAEPKPYGCSVKYKK
jgi:peroxiredoxin